jgi:septum formation protein
MTALWRGKGPLILASESRTRQYLLRAAGIPFEACAAHIDERKIEAQLAATGAGARQIASELSRAKALAVSTRRPGRLVAGADQVPCLNGRLFAKPADHEEALAQLKAFSGRTHELYSGLAIVRDGIIVFETVCAARLTCRNFSPDFIKAYAADGGVDSTGVYRIEGLGMHLFDAIEGEHTVILGLPVLPLLKFLREDGSLLS